MKLIKIAAMMLLVLAAPAMAAPAPITVATIAALQAGNFSSYATVQVLGYNAAGDGGGGFFSWSPASAATEDHCVTFKTGNLTTGRFLRQLKGGSISVLECGAYKNNSNGATTRAAFQYAFDYVTLVSGTVAPVSVPAGTYLFDTTGITKASSLDCPVVQGDGVNITTINFSPAAEAAAFTYIGGSGAICNGGVRGLRVNGNANTIGVEARGQSGLYNDLRMDFGKEPVLLCSCGSGLFSENDVSRVYIPDNTNVTRAIEYRTNAGGTGSFRHSGLAEGTSISTPAATANALVLIGSGSQTYNFPLNVELTNNSAGTVNLVDNQSANFPTATGVWDIEATTASSLVKLSKTNVIYFSGAIQKRIGASAQLVYGPIVFGPNGGVMGTNDTWSNSYYLLESATSVVQHLTAGTGATTALNAVVSVPTSRVYTLSLFSAGYNWNGQVIATTNGTGTWSTAIVAGHRFAGGADPTFSVVSDVLNITVPDAISSNQVQILGSVNMAGELL